MKTNHTEKPNYTPGPWKQHATFIWSASAKANIAALSGLRTTHVIQYVQPEVGDKDLGEIFANGSLIAAAPELLEALENLLKMVEFVGLAETPVEFVPKIERTGEAARQAIAKAKGL